jgi:hypothetical protein
VSGTEVVGRAAELVNSSAAQAAELVNSSAAEAAELVNGRGEAE